MTCACACVTRDAASRMSLSCASAVRDEPLQNRVLQQSHHFSLASDALWSPGTRHESGTGTTGSLYFGATVHPAEQ